MSPGATRHVAVTGHSCQPHDGRTTVGASGRGALHSLTLQTGLRRDGANDAVTHDVKDMGGRTTMISNLTHVGWAVLVLSVAALAVPNEAGA